MVALNGEVVVIGGFAPQVASSVLSYSPSANTWRSLADFPSALHHANAAVVDGKLYVAGFYPSISFAAADPRTFVYESESNRWLEKASMPAASARAASCVAVLGSKIFLFGGASGGTRAEASAYDTAADSCASVASSVST